MEFSPGSIRQPDHSGTIDPLLVMDAVPNGPQVPDGEEHAAQCGHMIHQ